MTNTAGHSTDDKHAGGLSSHLNSLRAAVLGANDGVVSVASIIFGVAGATHDEGTIFTAGLAGLVAGAFSMAVGEYISVSTQRDTERAYISHEKWELRTKADAELAELADIYESKGLSASTAKQVAKELTAHDALKAHLDAELNIDQEDLTNPLQAAAASFFSFIAGALIPLLSVILASAYFRIAITFVAVMLALTLTGYLSATAGGSSRQRAILRVVVGGAIAMVLTYLVGHLFGTAVS